MSNSEKSSVYNSRLITALFWGVLLAIIALAAGSFALSFNALLSLAIDAGGIPPRLAWVWPLIVDLSLVVYTATILTSQLQRWPVWFPASLAAFYAVVTVTGNVIHAPATPVGWFIAALPPVSLLLATEALRSLLKQNVERSTRLATLADIQAEAERLAAERDTFAGEVEKLTGKRDTLAGEVAGLRREKKQQSYAGIGDETRAAALVLLRNDPKITGAELGRKLGRSDSTGRKLRRELLPTVTANGNG